MIEFLPLVTVSVTIVCILMTDLCKEMRQKPRLSSMI